MPRPNDTDQMRQLTAEVDELRATLEKLQRQFSDESGNRGTAISEKRGERFGNGANASPAKLLVAAHQRTAEIRETLRRLQSESTAGRFRLQQAERRVWELRVKNAEIASKLRWRERVLHQIQSSPVWKATKPLWKLIGKSAEDATNSKPPEEIIFGIDAPMNWTTSRNVLQVEGWCFSRSGRELAGVRAKIGRKGIYGHYGIERPDVGERLHHWPAARFSGFTIDIPVPRDPVIVRFEAIEYGGDWQPFFEHELRQDEIVITQEIPLPPPSLMTAVAGHADDAEFARSRLSGPRQMLIDLRAAGIDPDKFTDVLDFGCGCGRFLAGWAMMRVPWRSHGCDYNPLLVAWCNNNIPGVIVHENRIGDILPYDSNSLDLVYLLSVFTHLTIPEQERLISEFHRVLRPRGYVYVTFHGEHFYPRMFSQVENGEQLFSETGFLIGKDTEEGTNDCWTLHSPAALAKLFRGFTPVKHFKSIDRGPTDIASWQDSMILQAQ